MSTLTVCYAVKGGSGATVTAAALALATPRDILLVDLDGELPTALGIAEPSGDGIAEWSTTTADVALLELLTVEVNRTTRLLPRGHQPLDANCERWNELATWLTKQSGDVIVDAGTRPPPPPLIDAADQTLLVTRACYLALRRAVSTPDRPTGIVLVSEPGRALRAADVERAVGVPVVTQLDVDPAVARAVDAGLLAARLPRLLQRQLAPISGQHPQTSSPTQSDSESPEAVIPARVCSIASIQTGDHGPRPVTVEVHVADGLPGYDIVGVDDQARRASRDRIRAAFINSGLAWPDKQITVNVMPAGHGTPDSAVDVAIAAGVLAATGRLDRTTSSNHAYVGELGLDGSIIAISDLDRSTVERVTGLPTANLFHLRDLPYRSSPTIDPATPGTVSSAQHVARWNAPPTPTVGPDSGLGGIA
jgi:hypothetical protein